MKYSVEERPVILGRYIVDTGATVRVCAKKYGISKSTVHKDLTDKLKGIDENLYKSVRKVLEINKAERHIRGGIATKNKYLNKKKWKINCIFFDTVYFIAIFSFPRIIDNW